MDKTKIWFLENFSMLQVLSPEEMKMMDNMASMRDAPRNQVLYFSEDSANSVYLLKKGKVKISKTSSDGREVILAILGPGEVFGELSVTGQEKREEIAEVTEDAVICKVDLPDFEKMMEHNPKFNLQVTKLIGFKLKKIQNRLENMIFKTSEQRVKSFIKETVMELGRDILGEDNQKVVELRLTQEDISKLTATSRQTVTTVFSDLEKKGIIKYDRRRIFVKDMKALDEQKKGRKTPAFFVSQMSFFTLKNILFNSKLKGSCNFWSWGFDAWIYQKYKWNHIYPMPYD
jgi:CRP-like cAMP-binding protein